MDKFMITVIGLDGWANPFQDAFLEIIPLNPNRLITPIFSQTQ